MPWPGALAEWLGRGLQSLVRRFESARRLTEKPRKSGLFVSTVGDADGAARTMVVRILHALSRLRSGALDRILAREDTERAAMNVQLGPGKLVPVRGTLPT